MAEVRKAGPKPVRHFLVAVAIILGVFGCIVLLIILPFLVGPAALLIAAPLGLGVFLAVRHHSRRRHPSPRIDFSLGWSTASKTGDASLDIEVTTSFALGVFIAVLLAVAVIIQLRYPGWGNQGVLWLIGGGIFLLATYLAQGMLASIDPRYALGIPFLVDNDDE